MPGDSKEKRRASGATYARNRRLREGDKVRGYYKEYSKKYRAARPYHSCLHAAKSRAKVKELPCDLTLDWAERTWTGFCEITGLPFDIDTNGVRGPKPFSPSIDRIIPEKGYIQNNCRFVLSCVNAFKGTMNDATLHEVAEALLRHKK